MRISRSDTKKLKKQTEKKCLIFFLKRATALHVPRNGGKYMGKFLLFLFLLARSNVLFW